MVDNVNKLARPEPPCDNKYSRTPSSQYCNCHKLAGNKIEKIIIDDPWNENEVVADEKKLAWKPPECELTGCHGPN